MNKDQPQLSLPKTPIQNALDIVALLGLIGFLVFFMMEWPGLPERIPLHFDGTGKPNSYGNKYIMILLPLLAIGNYFLFLFLNKNPHTFNYPMKITEENTERQYTLVRNMMSGLNAGIILSLFYTTWGIVSVAKEETTGLGPWFLPIFLGLTMLPIVIYLVVAFRK